MSNAPLYFIDFYSKDSLKRQRVVTSSKELQDQRLKEYVAAHIVVIDHGTVKSTPQFRIQWVCWTGKIKETKDFWPEMKAKERMDNLRMEGINAWLVPA